MIKIGSVYHMWVITMRNCSDPNDPNTGNPCKCIVQPLSSGFLKFQCFLLLPKEFIVNWL